MLDQFLWGHSSRVCDISCFKQKMCSEIRGKVLRVLFHAKMQTMFSQKGQFRVYFERVFFVVAVVVAVCFVVCLFLLLLLFFICCCFFNLLSTLGVRDANEMDQNDIQTKLRNKYESECGYSFELCPRDSSFHSFLCRNMKKYHKMSLKN